MPACTPLSILWSWTEGHAIQSAQGHVACKFCKLQPDCGWQIGQAGGCAPLVGMLTSATAVHSSVISFQMTVDHDEAQAHAATALAHLAALSSNQVNTLHSRNAASACLLARQLQSLGSTCLCVAKSASAQSLLSQQGLHKPLNAGFRAPSFPLTLPLGLSTSDGLVQKKIVEAGGISPLVLSLSFGFPALQAAAAKCLHSLALDAEYLELVVEAGALTTLTTLLQAEKVEHSVQAAAAEALGAIIKDEHMAADAIPILVGMMCSGITEVSQGAVSTLKPQ